MFQTARPLYESQLREIREAGLYKSERTLASPQNRRVDLPQAKGVLNLCANNYLGLAEHPEVVAAAHAALDQLKAKQAPRKAGSQRGALR